MSISGSDIPKKLQPRLHCCILATPAHSRRTRPADLIALTRCSPARTSGSRRWPRSRPWRSNGLMGATAKCEIGADGRLRRIGAVPADAGAAGIGAERADVEAYAVHAR
jgi:hypothetical protein